MKKSFTLSVLAAALFLAVPSQAQVKFGLKAGLNVSNMSFSNDVLDASNRAGWFAGPMVKISLPVTGLGIDASAVYDYRSAKVTDDEKESTTVKQQQIAIPVNVRYGVGLGSLASVFVFAGPQWGINVGDKTFKWNETSSYSLKKSNFSVNVGLGATVASHLEVKANYNIACGKTADASVESVSGQLGQQAIDAVKGKSHNNSWQISVGYYF